MNKLSYEDVFQTNGQVEAFDTLIDELGRENVSTFTWGLGGSPDDLHFEKVNFLYQKELPGHFVFVSYGPQGYPQKNQFFISACGGKEYFYVSNPFEAAAKIKEIDASFKKEEGRHDI